MDIRATMPYLRLLWPLSPSPHVPKEGPSEPTSSLENSCLSSGGRAWPDSTPTPQELWDCPHPPAPHVHSGPERGHSALCWDRSIGCLENASLSLSPTPCPLCTPGVHVGTQSWLPRPAPGQRPSHVGGWGGVGTCESCSRQCLPPPSQGFRVQRFQ